MTIEARNTPADGVLGAQQNDPLPPESTAPGSSPDTPMHWFRALSRAVLGALSATAIGLFIGCYALAAVLTGEVGQSAQDFQQAFGMLLAFGGYLSIPSFLVGILVWWLAERRGPISRHRVLVAGAVAGALPAIILPPFMVISIPAGAAAGYFARALMNAVLPPVPRTS